jgi:hypothetical protein
MTLCVAIMMLIIIRQHHETPMLPAACLSALLCPLLVWPFAAPFDVGTIDAEAVPVRDHPFGRGLVFLTIGGQMVSATEHALINTLETPLTVAWVRVCFSEVPSIANFAGGMIVMTAVVGHVWLSNRSRLIPGTR